MNVPYPSRDKVVPEHDVIFSEIVGETSSDFHVNYYVPSMQKAQLLSPAALASHVSGSS